jgi:LmbE family N-acetylglucosaminyl deacetylase
MTRRLLATAFLVLWASVGSVASASPETPAPSAAGAPLDVLVVAPHSDDEAIGCTAVMLRAIREGRRVGIVVVTNGDGHVRAAAAIAGKPEAELTPQDFIALTGTRQQHSITAMAGIGVAAGDLVFLGYPDLALKEVYAAEGPPPVRQVHTEKDETYGVVVPDYHSTVHGRPAPYLRASVVGDLTEIIQARQPREIYVTNEADTHNEHEATFWVVRDAAKAAGWRGSLLTYVVHGGPLPEGPTHRIPLTEEELIRKRAILEEYARHMSPVHDGLADKYTKPEEVFWPVPIE